MDVRHHFHGLVGQVRLLERILWSSEVDRSYNVSVFIF